MARSATSKAGATDEPAIEVYADTRRQAACASCNATVEWLTSVTRGEPVPFNARQYRALSKRREKTTRRVIERVALRTNHWDTCPGKSLF